MKTYSKLVIPSLFYFFCILKSTFGDTCNPVSCPRGTNTSTVSGPPNDFSVQYPFYINELQPVSCGMPDFDLYCDKSFGTLIQLPNEVVLRVDAILYSSQDIYLSDPYNCLPHKLMTLNLTKTPFYPVGNANKFWLYNCSGEFNDTIYDRIDCLSGLNYTVISSGYDIIQTVGALGCLFLNVVDVPGSFNSIDLSNISKITLAWNGNLLPPAPQKVLDEAYNSRTVKFVLIFSGVMTVVLIVLFCGCLYFMNRNERVPSTVNTNGISNTPDDVAGLDQVTIDSYPIVVVGESGPLAIHNDLSCSICLENYQPREKLKTLPECLHRFHAECIDQWLRSKGICPICRTPPIAPM